MPHPIDANIGGAASFSGISPEVACRFSALELVALAMRSIRGVGDADQRWLHTTCQQAQLPPHLLTRLRHILAGGSAVDVWSNPYLSDRQQIALVLLVYRAGGDDVVPALRTFAARNQMPDAVLNFLAARVREVPVAGSSFAESVLEPPASIVPLVQDLAFRIRLGAANAAHVGHIPPTLYEHPTDRASLTAVRGVAGFETLARKYAEFAGDRIERVQSIGGRIRVSHDQLPVLYSVWREALARAGFGFEPEFFVDQGFNACTRGVNRKEVVLGSSLVSLLEPGELLFVLGHELGHIRSEHVLYRSVAESLPALLDAASAATLGLSTLVTLPLRLALLDWYRKSEFTCDRFGLLVCQDLDAAGRVLMKVAGAPITYYRSMDWRVFAAQGAEVDVNEKLVDKLLAFAAQSDSTHPWPAVRAADLIRWVDSGDYARLLASNADEMRSAVAYARIGAPYAAPPRAAAPRWCTACGLPLEPAQMFCDACGDRQG